MKKKEEPKVNDQTISALRETLFHTLHAVEDGTMDIKKARQMASIAQVIVNTVKVELDYKRQFKTQNVITMLET